MRRALTLVELCFTIAVLAVLAALAVPAYRLTLHRAWAAEAPIGLRAIADAELRYFRDHGAFLACAPEGPVPSPTGLFPADEPCWQALGMRLEGDLRYRYGVTLDGGAYTVVAEGDLDRDGVASRYVLTGNNLAITETEPLE
jgi:type II secretory pathway pseudopilin PulG